MTTKGRPPKLDPNKFQLTANQRERVIGGLLGDCWIEMQKGAKNARVGLQITVKNAGYFLDWCNEFKGWLETKENGLDYTIVEKSYDNGTKFPQMTCRTYAHPGFTELYNVFKPVGVEKKTIPALSWLKANFTRVSLAEVFMQDGSRHGINAAPGFDIHSQGFTFEGAARFSLLLIEAYNLYAWPTRDVKRDKTTGLVSKVYWTVYISCDSYDALASALHPYVLADSWVVKSHPAGQSKTQKPNPLNKTQLFIQAFANNTQLREDVTYVLPEAEIQAYADAVSRGTTPVAIKPQI